MKGRDAVRGGVLATCAEDAERARRWLLQACPGTRHNGATRKVTFERGNSVPRREFPVP